MTRSDIFLENLRKRAAESEQSSFYALRQLGVERLVASELPTPKQEIWRQSPLRQVYDCGLDTFAGPSEQEHPFERQETETGYSIGIDNGFVKTIAAPKHCTVRIQVLNPNDILPSSLTEITNSARTLTGSLAETNAVGCSQIVYIQVPDETCVAEAISLQYTGVQTAYAHYPRIVIELGRGSEAKVHETWPQQLLSSGVRAYSAFFVLLGPHAVLKHTRARLIRSANVHWIGFTHVQQQRKSQYNATQVLSGGGLNREEVMVQQVGSNSHCELNALCAAGTDSQVDLLQWVDHPVSGGSSVQQTRALAGGNGKCVFDGTIEVGLEGAGTEAHQYSKNLILSEDARIFAKPHLRISIDDVVCSHGCSVGHLDPDQVFYLQSRGLDVDAARQLLVESFVNTIFERFEGGISASTQYRNHLFDGLQMNEGVNHAS